MRTFAYVALAVLLCVFGFLTLFSIGVPLFLTGVAMLAVTPWRRRRTVLWPALAAPWAFTLGYVLIAPLGCTSSGTAPSQGSLLERTECSNLLGIDYSGVGGYQPPLLPAALMGLAVAVVSVVAVHRLARARRPDA